MNFASYVLPCIVTLSGIIIFFSKKEITNEFFDGCKSGINTVTGILPSLVILVVGVKMFAASGAPDIICCLFSDFCEFLKIPNKMLPVILMRGISGSGATAAIKTLFEEAGADSIEGLCASVLLGSSDTIIYTLSIYFSHIKIKKSRYAYPLSFIVMLFCTITACYITRIFF